ncbi:YwmB family TATA-box binding protein [Clostridium sp. 'deep sea']|uniref:YwmB family TATA-box binding protein n=1 Tax=Clostridium sp. 'deep sea' TaxID=2779445 RepID=UPI0018967868|nr:YwmB family TATA-box binding protein [Clostridium sp. 'deep sea']QOR33775.1 YwmB family TATA-box binding protein [Clostridium sp. 'deep sea']
MTKKVAFIFCLLTLTTVVISASFANSTVDASIEAIKNAWIQSNCNTLSSNLSIYAKMQNQVLDQADMEQQLKDLIGSLKLSNLSNFTSVNHEGYREVTVTGKLNDGEHITLSMQTFYDQKEVAVDSNILINIDGNENIDRLLSFHKIINTALEQLSAKGQINCSVLGFVDSNTPEEDVISLITKLVKLMQCDITDFFVDNQVISLCGNSPLLNEKPYGWSFNMQISARKDDEGRYYLWLGYPAIASSY